MKAKLIYESLRFERGQDPKSALGIGVWRNGYKIDKDLKQPLTPGNYRRIDFSGSDWNFGKKEFFVNQVSKTKITPDMAKKIENVPVVTFKYFYEHGGFTGLFGDWPEDFPFTRTPFIANVLEDEGRSFLIEPEGYYYPRYMTELV